MIEALGMGFMTAAGAVLVSRFDNRGAQWLGGAALAAALVLAPVPARAHPGLAVEDNSRGGCLASKSELPRFSLVGVGVRRGVGV